jgi:hypothetical protein
MRGLAAHLCSVKADVYLRRKSSASPFEEDELLSIQYLL